MNDVIRNILSAISILISIIALIYSMRTSYNPKIRIEPLLNKETELINYFFDFEIQKLIKGCRHFFLFIPWAILVYINTSIHRKKIAYGMQYNDKSTTGNIILWIRMINPSKYPITIYDIEKKGFLPTYQQNTLNNIRFENIDLSLKYNNKNIVKIRKNYDDCLNLPITIDPFSYTEQFLIIKQANSIISQRKHRIKKIKLIFHTSTKCFSKKIKIYNGNKRTIKSNINLKIEGLNYLGTHDFTTL